VSCFDSELIRKAGYREGITDGKLSTLQEGFDSSFTSSVKPSRTLGGLRGRASALLSLASIRSTNTNLDALRDLMKDLNRVKRNDILPIDTEREEHERDEHGDDNAFELEGNEKRDMEGLESALESLGSVNESAALGKREDDLLKELEGRLERLEREMKGMTD